MQYLISTYIIYNDFVLSLQKLGSTNLVPYLTISNRYNSAFLYY